MANNKDKPVTIFEIYAVLDNDIAFSIDKIDPPMILKSLETISISAKPYSALYIGEQPWEPDPLFNGKLTIYLSTPVGIVKCKNASHPGASALEKLNHFNIASKITNKFNGIVYSREKAAYAITYKNGSAVKTAIIDVSGFITGDWNYQYNAVQPEHMRSVEGIKEFLRLSKADVAFTIYSVDRLE